MRDSDVGAWEAHNVGTGMAVSVLELLATFEEATGIYVPVLMGERRQGDLASVVATVADTTSQKLGNWRPEVSLAESCRRGWAFMCRDVRQDEVD
jgi:UDP-glucose 4-epimerase